MSEWGFDEAFQRHYLAFLLQDTDFLNQVKKDITPELFSSKVGQSICRLILGFEAEHKSSPGELIFAEVDLLATKAKFSKDHIEGVKSFLRALLDLKLQNRTFILKEHNRFFRHQRLVKAVPRISELVRQGNFEDAERILKEIVTFRPGRSLDPGVRYDADPYERINKRETTDESDRLWLLIPEIDKYVDGLAPGELGVLQSAESSLGKTMAMVHIAKAAGLQGMKTLIYSLEESEDQYQKRLDQCIAGVTPEGLFDRDKIRDCCERWFRHGGEIWIKQFPGQVTTISDLREHKLFLENVYNFRPDVVIVDYADELAAENLGGTFTSRLYESGKQVYSGLRSWAVDDDLRIWTGMQSTRGASEAAVAKMEHAGESIAKTHIADLILSINRTAEEHSKGLTRIHIVKNRRGPSRVTKTIKTKFETQEFYKSE